MFVHAYFPADYFPEEYFPGGEAVIDVASHFHHGYFPADYFANDYFPGEFVSVVVPEPEPEPPVLHRGGVGFPRRLVHAIPAIYGGADLTLPAFEFAAYGYTAPAEIHAAFDGPLQAILALNATATARAADRTGRWDGRLPILQCSAEGYRLAALARVVTRQTDDEDEQLVLEHYLRTR